LFAARFDKEINFFFIVVSKNIFESPIFEGLTAKRFDMHESGLDSEKSANLLYPDG